MSWQVKVHQSLSPREAKIQICFSTECKCFVYFVPLPKSNGGELKVIDDFMCKEALTHGYSGRGVRGGHVPRISPISASVPRTFYRHYRALFPRRDLFPLVPPPSEMARMAKEACVHKKLAPRALVLVQQRHCGES